MRVPKLFLTSAAFLILGLGALWSKWNGSAGINAGSPISVWAVNFCGSVNGWPALIGVVSIVGGLLVFLWAVISAVMQPPRT